MDGSSAIVSANANGRDIDVDTVSGTYGRENDYGYSMFKANQNAGVGEDISGSTLYGDGILPGYTWASQEGKIKNVDSATVSAFASTPNGDASLIQAWIANGTLEFGGEGKHKVGIDYPDCQRSDDRYRFEFE